MKVKNRQTVGSEILRTDLIWKKKMETATLLFICEQISHFDLWYQYLTHRKDDWRHFSYAAAGYS